MSDVDRPTGLAKYQALLLSKGLSLEELGLEAKALRRQHAIVAVEELRRGGVTILGGDVYWLRDTGAEPAYANWYSDRRENESDAIYAARSCDEARRYIAEFPRSEDATPVFSLVVKYAK
jgi:hypothetical protein